jgi:DNA polymerase elongation subunit (family B)
MIQLYDTKYKKYIILGRKEFTGTFEQSGVEYLNIPDEKKLLNTFMDILRKLNPTAIKTFNGLLFDFPYLTNRIKLLGLDYTRLSPVGDVKFLDEVITQDGMTGIGVTWEGLYLVDLSTNFAKFSIHELLNNLCEYQNQCEFLRTLSAHDRLKYIEKEYPFLLKRVKQKYLCSFLNIEATYLSKLLNQKVEVG